MRTVFYNPSLHPACYSRRILTMSARTGGFANVTAGKNQFQQTCGFCHGPDARGASGPDLIRSSLVSHDKNGDLIGQVVHNGRPEKGMPAFQLSDTEISNIAQCLHAQAKIASSVSQRIPSEYPVEKLLVGNPAAGRAYFNGELPLLSFDNWRFSAHRIQIQAVRLTNPYRFSFGASPRSR